MKTENEQHLAKEFLYAANKMQEVAHPQRKLFYFSVLFSEAQRVLNIEWDRDLALVFAVSNHTYTQVNGALQSIPVTMLPINWETVFEKLTRSISDIGTYYQTKEKARNKEELLRISGQLAEIAYAVSGNGSYLMEKGVLKWSQVI